MGKKSSGKMSFVHLISLVVFLAAIVVSVFCASLLFRRSAKSALAQQVYTKQLEFAGQLDSQITLALQMCKSPAVIRYMEEPDNSGVKEAAFAEIDSYQKSFLSGSTFLISDTDHRYYFSGKYTYTLDPKDPESAWYSPTLNSREEYLFNINYDKGIKQTFLWINVPVRNKSGRAVGIAGTGIPLGSFVDSMYANLDSGLTMYLYNTNREVTGSTKVSDLENAVPVTQVMSELGSAGNLFPTGTVFHTTGKGVYAIAPLGLVDWHIVMFKPYTFSSFLENYSIPFVVIMVLGILLTLAIVIRRLIQPINDTKRTVQEIASGNADLTRRVSLKTSHEIKIVKLLVTALNTFMERLQSIVRMLKDSESLLASNGRELRECAADSAEVITRMNDSLDGMERYLGEQGRSVEQTAGAVNEISANIDSLNRMIENQTTGVSQASSAVTQMISNIASVNKSIEKLASSFESLADQASNGAAKQEDVNTRILQIQQQSELLQDANQMIAAIAEQTNLLAMNAAIEAAHAGEAGKGFSVVADEIRKLSETSSSHSKTIGEQLHDIQESISGIVGVSMNSAHAFENVAEGIRSTASLTEQIRLAMAEQDEGSKQISQALQIMNDSTGEVHSASGEMAEGSKAILAEVGTLQSSTHAIQDAMALIKSGAGQITQMGETLSSVSETLDESITQIGSQIDEFKV